MFISRHLQQILPEYWNDSKAIIILGPRQAGKTTLLRKFLEKQDVLWLNGDDADVRAMFENPSSARLRPFLANNKTLVLDEAQRIRDIGICLKIIVDNFPGLKVLASGSSSFDLANLINEPLTGRKWEFICFPVSFAEMTDFQGFYQEHGLLEHRLIYGYYPDIINSPGKETAKLKELAGAYLYKDILTWERIMKPDRLEKLVQALAFQVGNQVSVHELGQVSGLDSKTVEKYLLLLERAFVIFRLNSFSRNLRNELTKSRKIYFYDNGLRNAIINQFAPINLRDDAGRLWENFLVSERYKYLESNRIFCNRYFWRTSQQQEIDYIEERGGILYAWEFKWSTTGNARIPLTFARSYPDHIFDVIHKGNYHGFISGIPLTTA
jgi:predicted AAA+ superfamily ATPase